MDRKQEILPSLELSAESPALTQPGRRLGQVHRVVGSVGEERVGRLGHTVRGSVPVGGVGASPWMMGSCPRVCLGYRVPLVMQLREGGEQEIEPEAREEVAGSRWRGEVRGPTCS